MALTGPYRDRTATTPVNHAPVVTLDELRIAAMDPRVLPAASAYARRWFPRAGSLARAA